MAESMFCSSCGEPLPAGAMFCGKCGNRVEAKTNDTSTNDASATTTNASPESGNSAQESPAQESPAQSAKFKKLMLALWISIGISLLSGLVQLTDVREYYGLGRIGCLFINLGIVALYAWLAFEIAYRRNWARVTYTVVTGLAAVLAGWLVCACSIENSFVFILDLVSFGIDIYCVVLMYGHEISGAFKPMQSGVLKAVVFGVAGILALMISDVIARVTYVGTDPYYENCARAAAKGSSDARAVLTEIAVAEYAADGEVVTEAEVAADVDQFIEEVVGQSMAEKQQSKRKLSAEERFHDKMQKARRNRGTSSWTTSDIKLCWMGVMLVLLGGASAFGWLKNKFGAIFGKA